MIKLLEIKHNGVVVAEAPMLIHDVEGTRAAILDTMEEGLNSLIGSEYLSLPLMACATPEKDYIGWLITTGAPAAEEEATA